ncbi:tetratricopeptide repeat protein [Nocardia sp. NPDC050710]|uniref:ATP-binding protein n=1 Tax=Nocardia sp. NPDC050710 TaxID=3157220 RepID=UPI0033F35DAA
MSDMNASAEGHARQVLVGGDNKGTIDLSIRQEAPRQRPVATDTLPRDIELFVGRETELSRILGAAQPSNVVSIYTIDGMAGIGKTALATRAAHLLADRFPDGRYFIDLHSHAPGQTPARPADVLATMLAGLGIDPRDLPETLEGRRDLWRDRLRDKRVLLVLDDAAHHAQVEPLLPGGSGCCTLITGRRRLVALDSALPLPLDTLAPDRAEELFYATARRDSAEADRPAVRETVRLCGYLPLAIVLLAGRLAHRPAWSVADLCAEFASARDRLGELEAGERAVQAAFATSYRHLPPARRRLFRHLGLHLGLDFDAYAVAALGDLDLGVARKELDALYTDHLIDETTPGRYRLHDLVREYTRKLTVRDKEAERERAVGRLLDYYRCAARNGEHRLRRLADGEPDPPRTPPHFPPFPDRATAFAWALTERANLLSYVDYAVAHDLPSHVRDLTGILAISAFSSGPHSLAQDVRERALTIARRHGDRLGVAAALSDIGHARVSAGDLTGARAVFDEGLTIYSELGDQLGQANMLRELGGVSAWCGDFDTATALTRRALELYGGNSNNEARALQHLGQLAMREGDYSAGEDYVERALKLYRDSENRQGEAVSSQTLGSIRERRGDYPAAIAYLEQALAAFRAVGSRSDTAAALSALGMVRQWIGDFDTAIDELRESLAIQRDLGNMGGECVALVNLGWTMHRVGDNSTASELTRQAIEICRAVGDRSNLAAATVNLAWIRMMAGDLTSAAELFPESLALFLEVGDRGGEAEARNRYGRLLTEIGDHERAFELYDSATDIARQIGNRLEQAHALEWAAHSHVRLGAVDRALTHLRAAIAIYGELGSIEIESATEFLHELDRN